MRRLRGVIWFFRAFMVILAGLRWDADQDFAVALIVVSITLGLLVEAWEE